jgi:hypothetical protein
MAAPAASLTGHPQAVEAARREAFEALKARLSTQGQAPPLPVEGILPSAIPELDRLLGGGLPWGTVATLEGATGRWSVAGGLVARVTRRSLVAILDDGTLYPPALAEAGACLERILVVPARKALQIVRAVDILLRSRICRLVLMPAIVLRDSVWSRLAKLAHRSGVLLIVITSRAGASLSAAAGLRLHCALERIVMHGTRGLWGAFAGFELCIGVRKHKHLVAERTARLRVGCEEMRHAALR